MSDEIRILTETDLRQIVQLDKSIIDCIENGFRQLASERVYMPPVLSMAISDMNAEVDVKTAYVPGLEGFAIKISPGFFNNPALGLPSLNGMVVLLSSKTGRVLAVFLDNGYLTEVRTAAAGAVAARHLAPAKIEIVGVVGTGDQARQQLLAVACEREFETVLVWGRDACKAQKFSEEMSRRISQPVTVAKTSDEVVNASQLVITATPATDPILNDDGLHSNLHITAMGSDQENKNEIAPSVLAAVDLIVCDRISQCRELGELRSALEAGALADAGQVLELGDLIAGKAPGRTSQSQITFCDLTGTGVQDTAIATLAYQRALQSGAGTIIKT